MFILLFSSGWITDWPSFGEELLTRLTICSLCISTICNCRYFPIWFQGGIWVPIALVPDHCIFVTSFIYLFKNNVQVNDIHENAI